mmetsp:Transcript_19678/g.52533  ORF Transcript_19678/g.52533 Transcript_19678/m.52533 type:complete len:550 (-) Transcript_19678:42-1691(-)
MFDDANRTPAQHMVLLPGQRSLPAWLWQPNEVGACLTRDPAALPNTFASAVKALQHGCRGPSFARLVPVTVLKTRARQSLVRQDNEEPQAVPSGLTIPWYEGLLLLDEMERISGRSDSVLWHREFDSILKKEKATRIVSGEFYVKRSLMDVAVTGPKVVDHLGSTCSYRRLLQDEHSVPLAKGEDGDGVWRLSEVLQYLPPWVAFSHPRCGIYQDFYLIRWAPPYASKSYQNTENGCEEAEGATWEPDECLPPDLDGLRLEAKRRWLASHRQEVAEPPAEEVVLENVENVVAESRKELAGIAPPSPKKQRVDEEIDVARPLFETISNSVDLKRQAKSPEAAMDMVLEVGQGTLPKQVLRMIDNCVREKRVTMGWAMVRVLLCAANEGPASPRTRLASQTVCELAKAKKVKLRAIEDSISAFSNQINKGDDPKAVAAFSGAVAWVLVHMFPHKREMGWGWSHPGWTWTLWWDFVARCLQACQPAAAYGILRTALEIMLSQDVSCLAIREMPTWADDSRRTKELRRRLGKMSGLSPEALVADLDHLGIEVG